MLPAEGEHMRPDIIAAYLNRAVAREEKEAIELHLLVCRDCRRDLAEAAELGQRRRAKRVLVWGAPAAAAAVLALFLLGPFGRIGVPSGGDAVLRGQPTEGTARFAALAPPEGVAVAVDSLEFAWRSAGGQVHYLLTLTDENGDVVWTTGTSDTTAVLPRSVGLQPGGRYFWYVDALLEGAASSTTGIHEFVVNR